MRKPVQLKHTRILAQRLFRTSVNFLGTGTSRTLFFTGEIMSQINETLSALTRLSPQSINPEDNVSVTVHDQNFNNMVSSTFNKISETDAQFKNVINTLSQSPHFTSDPQKLLMLQNYIGEYSNYVSLVSTLARKGVSTIETLEKSQ